VPNAQGGKTDVELGYDDFASYEKGSVYGAVIGRVAGRISHGGSFTLNGKTYQLEKPNPDAKFVIHGGTAGYAGKVWTAKMQDGAEPSLILTLHSPDGDGGFPGALDVTLTYTITLANELKLDYRAEAEAPTIVSLTNHSYFALQGEGKGDISGQTLQVFADKYTPADADNLETGEILPVDGTPLDFRKGTRLGDVLHSDFPQIAMRQGLDINMVINGRPGTLRPAARLSDPNTGIVMDVSTTEPCVQLYSDGIGDRTLTGKGGKTYRSFYAMSLETQNYLDAINHPNFPSMMLEPGKPLHEMTVFKFGHR
jgi:aldose 1-epimerase